ncbi:peptidoglycan-recognition protein SB2-like [Macrosteles quadrilineatus]|uniref:peptidoglycan-recognition protein SB2-like n=1 Tax=Macrosteles quadrilineatus TaxID=74068 RepID=UPI0023E0CE18|nr:peptidoglycan-recognition protein SB2-like [Macrosteles quadrilineatus]
MSISRISFAVMGLRIIPRISWSNTRVNRDLPRLFHPVTYVLFTYVFNPYVKVKERGKVKMKPDYEYVECISKLDTVKMEKVEDIRYNFMIGPRGNVFEGRGWHKRPALPRRFIPLQGCALYVAYLGYFKKNPPPDEMLDTRLTFMLYGIKYRYIKKKCNEITM